ncbi:MAG TPA: hypothetical protein VFW23_16050 [Tepidisphaeraceae bacterium]|nr:hypothetical protein [Tepidisphaeraceae bacterium]
MNEPVTSHSVLFRLLAALERQDRGQAEQLLKSAPIERATLVQTAERMMAQAKWGAAAWLLRHIPDLNGHEQVKRQISRNLESLQRHRPALYRLLVSLPSNPDYGIGLSKTGMPTVAIQIKGTRVSLSPGNDPEAALTQALSQIRTAIEAGRTIGLVGIGDGYLLNHLAHTPPPLYMDEQLPVYVFEPDPQVVLQCMMIHDYSGPEGPIEQGRVHWFVGSDWDAEYESRVSNDSFMACPSMLVGQSIATQDIGRRLATIARAMEAVDGANAREIESYYHGYDPGSLGTLLNSSAPRKPRALLLTTRFSTVLQHSTRSMADALENLGWETQIIIEPSPYHRAYRHAIRQTIAEFKPDLWFQIDHLRYEHDGLLPGNLPAVCWVQDHLSNLMSRDAGRSVGETDFVLTDAGSTYIHKYGYPARQIIALTKLTQDAAPAVHTARSTSNRDIVFVSNASGTPESLLQTVLDNSRGSERDRKFLRQCVQRVQAIFDSGRCLSTYSECCDLLRTAQADLKFELDEAGFFNVSKWLTHPLADALYRQQALRWAAHAADDLGLSLCLYGKGWEHNPEFKRFARGPVGYGKVLDDLTAQSAINLQVVPYLSLHQRLLDGISAGGFFLIRQHESDVVPQQMLDLLEQHADESVRTLAAARNVMPSGALDRFEQLLSGCIRTLCSQGTEDPIEMVRHWQEAQILVPGDGILPHFEQVSFTDAATLRQRIEHFISNPELRQSIIEEQRRSIASRLTYRAGLSRVVSRVAEFLEQTKRIDLAPLITGKAA